MTELLKTRRSVLGAPQVPAAVATETAPAPAGASGAAVKPAGPQLSVVVIEDPAALAELAPAWQELADAAIEPNPFYEPWMLLPAIPAYGGGRDLLYVFVQATDPSDPAATPVLCGFFPLARSRRYAGLTMALPIASLSLWKYPFCYVCTPLLRGPQAPECLAAFFAWLASGGHGCSLMEFGFVAGDGPFWQFLADHCERRQRPYHVTASFLRALFRPRGDAESDIRGVMHPSRLRELRRHERRLADGSSLEYAALAPDGDVDAWIEEFLRVEEISWKGKGGRALAGSPVDRDWFTAVAREGARRGQLMMLALRRNGRAIAHKCNFLAGAGSFAFKIAFDEEHARHSPGVLLELENIRQLHGCPQTRWMDSCADAAHPMLDRLWPDRRTIQYVVVGTGRWLGDWVVAALPLLRLLKWKLSARRRSPASR